MSATMSPPTRPVVVLTADMLRDVHVTLSAMASNADAMIVSTGAYVELVRATERDPYRRAMLLYNAGCRGEALR